MGRVTKMSYFVSLVWMALNHHFKGSCGSSLGKDEPTTGFHRNYTGVYFDPLDFMRYNGLRHKLDESGLAVLVNKIHTEFSHIMVPFHIPPTTDQYFTNFLLPETAARENVRLNGSAGSKSPDFIKVIVLCKFRNLKESEIFVEHIPLIQQVVGRANSIFRGTVTFVILEMENRTANEEYHYYAKFRILWRRTVNLYQGSECRLGLLANIKPSGFMLVREESLRDDTGTVYILDNMAVDISGRSARTYTDTLKNEFGQYHEEVRGLSNNTEIGFMATWPDANVEGRTKYKELVDIWFTTSNWAVSMKTLVIFMQAFDTPFSPESMMLSNGWWRLVPNSSYLKPSQFVFEDKLSLSQSHAEVDDEEYLAAQVAWLRQETQFSADNIVVSFNPDILRSRPDNMESSLKTLIQQISSKFSKIFMSMTALSNDKYEIAWKHPQAGQILSEGGKALDLYLGFSDATVTTMITKLAQTGNETFFGTVKHLIYAPARFRKYETVDTLLKIGSAPGGLQSFGFGILVNVTVCFDWGEFLTSMELAKGILISVASRAKVIYIVAPITHEQTKLGVDSLLPMYTAMLETCRTGVEDYFNGRWDNIQVAYWTGWPLTDTVNHNTLTEFVKFWEQMNEFALSTNSTIIFSSAFDDPGTASSGWWTLLENDTVPVSGSEFLFEDKKTSALRHAEEELSKKIRPVSPVRMWEISVATLIISIILLAIVYFLISRKSKYLTRKDIAEFFNGGDNNSEGIKDPYKKELFELSMKSFTIKIEEESLLGSGEFGKVYPGMVNKDGVGNKRDVAVKMTTVPCPRMALRALLFEIKILAYLGSHPHIVELVGAYTAELKKGKAFVFLELCEMGSLEGYLRKLRPPVKDAHSNIEDESRDESISQCLGVAEEIKFDMCRWSGEIANGMEFIASKRIVHRDIASRNVLLTADKRAKITDFGLSRRLYGLESYAKKTQEPLPWRWMAPESLRTSEFTEKSDVWGFGVLLWEIYSLGDEPYPGLAFDFNFAAKLENGLRLDKPTYSHNEMYSIMLRCWTTNPGRRPPFSELAQCLRQFSSSESCPALPKSSQQDVAVDAIDLSVSNAELRKSPAPVDLGVLPDKRDRPCIRSPATRTGNGVMGCSVGKFWCLLCLLLVLLLMGILVMSVINYKKEQGNIDGPKLDTTFKPDPEDIAQNDSITIGTSHPSDNQQAKGIVVGQSIFDLIDQNDLGSVTNLLQSGVDVNARNWDYRLETPIIRAAYGPNISLSLGMIKLLVDHGADVCASDTLNRTFLHVLLSEGRVITPQQFHDITEYLIAKNRSISSLFRMPGWSNNDLLLHMSIQNVEVEKRTLALLQENGVDFNIQSKGMGNNVLAYAIIGRRSPKLLNDLKELGVDWQHLNNRSRSLLHIAAEIGCVDAMISLIKLGLDPDAQDYFGNTPILQAVLYGQDNIFEIVQLLVANGAKVKVKNHLQNSALEIANLRDNMLDRDKLVKLLIDTENAEETPAPLDRRLFDLIELQQETAIKELVESGTDLNIRNDNTETPLFRSSYCSNGGDLGVCLRIIKYLIESGADVYASHSKNRTFLHNLVGGKSSLTPSQVHDITTFLISKNMTRLFNTRGFSFGVSPLHLLVKYVDELETRTLSMLQKSGADFNLLDKDGDSILTWSILGGRSVKFLSELVALGANWTLLNKSNRSLLHVAAERGHVDGLKYFMRLGLNVDGIDAHGDTPLHRAVFSGAEDRLETIRILVEGGANLFAKNEVRKTPMSEITQREDGFNNNKFATMLALRAMDATLRKGLADLAPIPTPPPPPPHQKRLSTEAPEILPQRVENSPRRKPHVTLFHAVGMPNENLVKVLVESGADVNIRDDKMQTPLLVSSYCSLTELSICLRIAKYLIEHGADVYAKDSENRTFLHYFAVQTALSPSQFHNLSEYLISKNISGLFNSPEKAGATPLHLAVGSINEVENRTLTLLQKNGVNFNLPDGDGNSILAKAVLKGRSTEILSNLVAHGANWRQLNYIKRSLVHVAARRGHVGGLKYFLSLGLDVNATDAYGDTPLHTAILFGEGNILKTVQLLVDSGASVRVKNGWKKTPLEEAINRRDFIDKKEVVQLLREAE